MRRRSGVQRRRGGRSRRLVNAGCSGCPPRGVPVPGRRRPSGAGHVPRSLAASRGTEATGAGKPARRRRAQRGYEPRRFSGPRKPAVDGQCRCDACTGSAESAVTHRHNVAQRLSRNSSQIPCVCPGGSRIVPLVPATGFSPEACSASRTAERRLTTTDAPTTGRPERRRRDPGSSRIRSAPVGLSIWRAPCPGIS